MKILFYNHTGQVSGAEHVMLMILSGLDRARFQPSVICPKDGELTRLAEQAGASVQNIEPLQARFTWRPDLLCKYLLSFIRVISDLRWRILETDPELIHANTIRAGLVATAATIGTHIGVIWHLHDLLPAHPLSVAIRCYAALSSRTSLLAVSHAVADRFHGGWQRLFKDGGKLRVIHNGVDLKRFAPEAATRRLIREELRIGEDRFVVGLVGQITPRKGQLELLRAFSRIAKRLPRPTLVIIGKPLFNDDQEYFQKLKQTVNALGLTDKVIFTGARRDVPAVMQALDLLVLNSKVEPLGLVVLEAMASGTPVLATAVDGVPELIRHGVSGWLIPPKDERGLAEALVILGNDHKLRSNLVKEAGRNVVPGFSSETYIRAIEAYYRRIGRLSADDLGRKLVAES